EIYIQAFPEPGAKTRVSTSGGGQPKWRRDGKELFYIGLDGVLMSVEIGQGTTLALRSPKPLFQTPIINVQPSLDQYAPSPDGQKFLVTAPSGAEGESPIVVVVNWSEELKRLIPIK